MIRLVRAAVLTAAAGLSLAPAAATAEDNDEVQSLRLSSERSGGDYLDYGPAPEASRHTFADEGAGLPALAFPSPFDGTKALRANTTLIKSGEYADDYAGTLEERLFRPKLAGPGLRLPEFGVAAAAEPTRYRSRCRVAFESESASPGPPAQGDSWAAAVAGRYVPPGLHTSGLQAMTRDDGQSNQVTESPQGVAQFAFGIDWRLGEYPNDSWVIAKVRPQWKGAIAGQSYVNPLGASEARGIFRASHGWWDLTLNTWGTGPTTLGTEELLVTNGTEQHHRVDKIDPSRPKDKLGIDLQPGKQYGYYNFAQVQTSTETQLGAPAIAAVDFGSRFLDTPASQYDTDGSSMEGEYRPGTDPDFINDDTFVMDFFTPNIWLSDDRCTVKQLS